MDDIGDQVQRYGEPVIIILGTTGAILNHILFCSRKQLRSTSCALYFRAMSLNDLLVMWYVIFTEWLSDQFNIAPANEYNWYCKLSKYLTYVFYSLSPYILVLVCFDRLCTSSIDVRLRRISTKRIALFIITALVIVICLSYSHTLVWFNLYNLDSDPVCMTLDAVYSYFLAAFLLWAFCFIPPILMIVLCTITFISLRQQRNRIMPVNQARSRQRDNQLLKMLFIYVTWDIICVVPFCVTYFIYIRNGDRTSAVINTLLEIFGTVIYLIYASSFYVYTLGTPFYRHELCSLLKTVWRRLRPENKHDLRLKIRRATNEPED
ncbi:unnamed protein product [Adineta ricciae]|uniref:G-protein coupled receptors family 1 profile domain-containing protein n=1 Tax=Adineta ricciae TaxID=249248 RepID=A0A813RT58_ADIRI|nr:unnamed protein product [Adineta ricciae]CAF0785248.1 unnamed protein product [Adineta ricciae]